MRQAQQVWSMLDDMADNDPAAYRAFIEKQKKERDSFMAPPEPHMCVKTQMAKPQKVPFYINFCTWKRIPAPVSPEEPAKVAGSAIGQINEGKGKVAITAVAFSEKMLEDYGKNAVNKNDQDTLIQIAMDFIEKQHENIKIKRKYTILDSPYKGSVKMIQESLTQAFNIKDKKTDDEVAEVMKNFAPFAMDSPETLLNQLHNPDKTDDDSVSSTRNGVAGITLNTQPVRKGLIEEVSSQTITLPEPTYDIEVKTSDAISSKTCVLRINLPGVKTVKDCQLDISRDDVYLLVEDLYELRLALPFSIMDSEASAKFSKKSSKLTVSLPVEKN